MASALDALKLLLEQVPPGHIDYWYTLRPKYERVIRNLTDAEIQEHEQICSMDEDLRALLKRSLRLVRLIEAKQTMLCESLICSNELLESAEARGKIIGLRKSEEDIPVVVEMDPEDTPFDED